MVHQLHEFPDFFPDDLIQMKDRSKILTICFIRECYRPIRSKPGDHLGLIVDHRTVAVLAFSSCSTFFNPVMSRIDSIAPVISQPYYKVCSL